MSTQTPISSYFRPRTARTPVPKKRGREDGAVDSGEQPKKLKLKEKEKSTPKSRSSSIYEFGLFLAAF